MKIRASGDSNSLLFWTKLKLSELVGFRGCMEESGLNRWILEGRGRGGVDSAQAGIR